jgi:hypothetical protein
MRESYSSSSENGNKVIPMGKTTHMIKMLCINDGCNN